jgi:hypothetical protein
VDITVSELIKITKDRMVTEHTYRDASGVELPLYLSSSDRIDPDEAYTADNVRLFVTGLNMLRRRCRSDAPVVAWPGQIPQTAIERSRRMQRLCMIPRLRLIVALSRYQEVRCYS